jgi:hypothetical protein
MRVTRSSTARRCQPRSSPAKACSSSTMTARRSPKSTPRFDRRETSMTSIDSGVVNRISGGSRRIPRRCDVADVAVPSLDPTAHEPCVVGQPRLQIVQQRLDGTDVEDAQPAPPLGEHSGEQREERRLGLAARGRPDDQGVLSGEQRLDRLLLERAQRRPPEGVHDVVLDRGMEAFEGRHRRRYSSRRTSSGVRAPRASRSTSVSSLSVTVRA